MYCYTCNHSCFYSIAINVGQINIFYFLVIEQECKSSRPIQKITELKAKFGRDVVTPLLLLYFKIMLNAY